MEGAMNDILLLAIGGFAAVACVLSTISLIRLNALVRLKPISKEDVAELLRRETDLVKKFGDDQARGTRQELSLGLTNFQNSTMKAFSTLVEFVGTQTKAFGDRLDSGVKAIDEKVIWIGDKLNADITRMGDDAMQNRDALRQAIESKLDSSAAKASAEAKNLRDELNGSFHRLGGNVSQT
jgi:DNA recombination protein RmuC